MIAGPVRVVTAVQGSVGAREAVQAGFWRGFGKQIHQQSQLKITDVQHPIYIKKSAGDGFGAAVRSFD